MHQSIMQRALLAALTVAAGACGGSDPTAYPTAPEGQGGASPAGTVETPPGDTVRPPATPYGCGSSALTANSHVGCGPMDAAAVGDELGGHCYCALGFAWNGSDCVALSDCACQGADCDKLAPDVATCQAQHKSCSLLTIEGCHNPEMFVRLHDQCAPMDATGYRKCNCGINGFKWTGTECAPIVGACGCVGADCDQLTQDLETCQEQHSNCPSRITCGSEDRYANVHDACGAMDASAVGEGDAHCNCFLGFAWNGTECVGLADCACQGSDCDKLTPDKETCEAQHQSCPVAISCGSDTLFAKPHDECEAMDAVAVGEGDAHCYCFLGFAWNGTECVGLADCACQGSDCDKLTPNKETCETQHIACS